jgi:hypothetical protein
MNTNNMKHNYSGKSLLELRSKYGTGASSFYPQSWYDNEAFATEKPEAGIYEIIFDEKTKSLTFADQKKKLKKEFSVAHPAIVVEAVLSHFKATGERLLENWYVRTDSVDSDGLRVNVGYFDADGLFVNDRWDGFRPDYLALASARKLTRLAPRTLESSSALEPRVKKLEADIQKVAQALRALGEIQL